MAEIVGAFGVPHTPVFPFFVKRDGKLVYAADKLAKLRDDILASRERLMHEAGYVYKRVDKGPMPAKFA